MDPKFYFKGQQTPDAKTVLSKKTSNGDINLHGSGYTTEP